MVDPRPAVARLHSLDLLRGFCAIGVAVYHFSLWSALPLWPPLHGVLAMFGTYGVSIFFVLSGYSLAHAYERNFRHQLESPHLKAYFKRRLARLAPLFALVVLVSLAGKLLVADTQIDSYAVLANLILLFGIVNPAATPVVGGWSIGVEVVFYIIFPLLMVLRGLAGPVIAASILLGAWIARDLHQFPSLAEGWLLYVHPANHAVFFCAGVYMRLFNRWVEHVPTRRLAVGAAVLLVVMGLAAAGSDSELALVTGWRRAVLVAASLGFVGLVAATPLQGTAARMAGVFGGLSYPLYLIHPVVFFGVRGRVEMVPQLVLGLLLLAIGLAVMADRWLDAPLQRHIKAKGW